MNAREIYRQQEKAIGEREDTFEKCTNNLVSNFLTYISSKPTHEGYVTIDDLVKMFHTSSVCCDFEFPRKTFLERVNKYVDVKEDFGFFQKEGYTLYPGYRWKVSPDKKN